MLESFNILSNRIDIISFVCHIRGIIATHNPRGPSLPIYIVIANLEYYIYTSPSSIRTQVVHNTSPSPQIGSNVLEKD